MLTLVVSLVLSRLDYGNATLVGLPIYLQRWLESVLNASARLIYDLCRSDYIFDALASLHWLHVSERVKTVQDCAPDVPRSTWRGASISVCETGARR